MNFDQSKAMQKKSHAMIPGGAHTYAKGDDQFPELSPGFIARGKGSHVWDVDGNEYIEYGMGLRAVTLGHAYEPVVEAAYRAMQDGTNFTRPAAIEVEYAEKLLSILDGADMVKFAKDGSDVTSGAVRLARAYTGRDRVAICASQPFFSVDDWFIGTTAMTAGIPEVVRNLTVKFTYNNLDSIRALFDQYPGEIACLIMEPERDEPPVDDFLQKAKALCNENGALFILDEMITGFRWDVPGAQKVYGIVPDLSTFGKAMSNGFSLSALAGRKEIMEVGGMYHNRERVWLLSTTHGGETHALAAALATLKIYQSEPVVQHLHAQGEKLIVGIRNAVAEMKLEGHFGTIGRSCGLVFYTRDQDKKPSQAFRSLFLQETIKRGLLMPSLVVSYSHSDEDIKRTLDGICEALFVYRQALEDGPEKYLVGRPSIPVMRKFN